MGAPFKSYGVEANRTENGRIKIRHLQKSCQIELSLLLEGDGIELGCFFEPGTSEVRASLKIRRVKVRRPAKGCGSKVCPSRKLKINERGNLVRKPHAAKVKILVFELGPNRRQERIQRLHGREVQHAITPALMLLVEWLSRAATDRLFTLAYKIGVGFGCG